MNPITGYVKYPEGEFLKNIRENYKDYYEREIQLPIRSHIGNSRDYRRERHKTSVR